MTGGSEYQYSMVKPIVPDNINLMLNDFNVDPKKINIHWQHQYYDQPSVQQIREVYDKLNVAVFVSHHQKQLFDKQFSLPYEKSIVIPNGVEPFPRTKKTNGKIKLIYASTPFRGLEILLAAYSIMLDRCKDLRGEVHLDVFSNMSLYGPSYEAQNSLYEGMYEFAKLHPAISYHGAVDRPILREYMMSANILAYPNTWEETSCCVAIEAMAAGVIPVVSNIGALPETCSVFGKYYSPMSTDMYNKYNKHRHAMQYSYILEREVRNYMKEIPTEHINKMIDFAEYGHSWDNVLLQWKEFFEVFSHHV